MTKQNQILGENTRPTRYNPKLAEQMTRQIEAEEKRAELEAKTRKIEQPITPQTNNPINPNAPAREDYVFVPSLGLYISKDRYLSGSNWHITQFLLHDSRRRMPTIPEFIEFLKYLRSPEGKENVNDADEIIKTILPDELEHSGEWLDARFELTKKDELLMSYHFFDNQGNIIKNHEIVEPHLRYIRNSVEDVGISLDEWLNNHTNQGLPSESCSKTGGNLYYSCPRQSSLSRFSFSKNPSLHCDTDLLFSHNYEGVRYVELNNPNEK